MGCYTFVVLVYLIEHELGHTAIRTRHCGRIECKTYDDARAVARALERVNRECRVSLRFMLPGHGSITVDYDMIETIAQHTRDIADRVNAELYGPGVTPIVENGVMTAVEHK